MTAAEALAFDFDTDALHHIPVELIDPTPENNLSGARTDTDDIDESIRQYGVQQAIKVRPTGDGRFRIVFGERRWRSCVKVGQPTIPAMIDTSETEPIALVEQRLVENLRKPLHDLDQGALFDELIELGRTQKEIAALLGDKSQPFVSEKIKLHRRLTVDAKGVFRAGLLTVKQAERLADIDEKHVDHIAYVLSCANDGRDVDAALRHAHGEVARLTRIENLHADLTARNIVVRTNGSHMGEEVLGATYGVMVDTDLHQWEPCHEALITTDGRTVLYLCSARDRHRPSGESQLKASNLTDVEADEHDDPIGRFAEDVERAATSSTSTASSAAPAASAESERRRAERDAQVAAERAEMEAASAAEARRLERMHAVIADTRSQVTALTLLVEQMAEDDGLAGLRHQLADALGVDDVNALTESEQVDRIRDHAYAGDDGRVRFALALAWSLGEVRLYDALGSYDDESTMRGARAHLRLLVENGYEPTDAERVVLDGPLEDLTPGDEYMEGDGDNETFRDLAARALDDAVDAMHRAAEDLRAAPSSGKKHTAAEEALWDKRRAVLDIVVAAVTDRDAFAAELHAIDLTSRLDAELYGSVVDDDESVARAGALEERLAQAFVDAGVPLSHETADDIRAGEVVVSTPDPDERPWLAFDELVDALDVELVADPSTRGPWLGQHSCAVCDASPKFYADQFEEPGPAPASDYRWLNAPILNEAGWMPSTAGLDSPSPHGRIVVDCVDTRGADVTPGSLWYRARCECGFLGDSHFSEDAALREAADHCWPEWRDGSDPACPVKIEQLCAPKGGRLCRGAVPHHHDAVIVVCSNVEHDVDALAEWEPLTVERAEQIVADRDARDVPADPPAEVVRHEHKLTKARADALAVVVYGHRTNNPVTVGTATTKIADFESPACWSVDSLTIKASSASMLEAEHLAYRSVVEDSWWLPTPEGSLIVDEDRLLGAVGDRLAAQAGMALLVSPGHTDALPAPGCSEVDDAWAAFVAARDALIRKQPATNKVVYGFEDAKRALAAVLARRHLDVFELTTALSTAVSSYRAWQDERQSDATAEESYAAIATAADAVLEALDPGSSWLPDDMVAEVRSGTQLVPSRRPSGQPGTVRRLHVDDVLAALAARP